MAAESSKSLVRRRELGRSPPSFPEGTKVSTTGWLESLKTAGRTEVWFIMTASLSFERHRPPVRNQPFLIT
jgi:hypothetical protein